MGSLGRGIGRSPSQAGARSLSATDAWLGPLSVINSYRYDLRAKFVMTERATALLRFRSYGALWRGKMRE
jgi:hypothetical protein